MALKFTDDTSMLGHDKYTSSLQSHINDHLKIVSKLFQVHKLSLNLLKSQFMLFTRGRLIIADIEI